VQIQKKAVGGGWERRVRDKADRGRDGLSTGKGRDEGRHAA
jgi:hypothetical protein